MPIQIKRAYDKPTASDGKRFLVDHLWPRGVSKARLKAEAWLKQVAPSDVLRKGFCHDPKKWEQFRTRYSAELEHHQEDLQPLLDAAHEGQVTLLYGARDTQYNNALVLKDYLEKRLKMGTGRRQAAKKTR